MSSSQLADHIGAASQHRSAEQSYVAAHVSALLPVDAADVAHLANLSRLTHLDLGCARGVVALAPRLPNLQSLALYVPRSDYLVSAALSSCRSPVVDNATSPVHAAVWRSCACPILCNSDAHPEHVRIRIDRLTFALWRDACSEQAPLLQLSALRSFTKLAAHIGNDQLDRRRHGASVMVST